MRFWKSKKITGTPTVGIAVAAYMGDPFDHRLASAVRSLAAAIQAQTYTHWKLDITHDGPYDRRFVNWVDQVDANDGRVVVRETPERKQQFGHPHRQAAIDRLMASGCEWIGLTNQDNYYVPTYLEWMVAEAQAKKAQLVYCDFVSSHKMWKYVPTELRRGNVDLGGFLAHRSIVEKIKFDKFTFAGDWDYISRLRGAAKVVAKVNAVLYTHN